MTVDKQGGSQKQQPTMVIAPFGTTPYYVVELIQARHSRLLTLLWVLAFWGLIALLARSNQMQFDCFAYCGTATESDCMTMYTAVDALANVKSNDTLSTCVDPLQSTWYSTNGLLPSTTTASTTTPAADDEVFWASIVDVVPDMHSPLRRNFRFIIQYDPSVYTTASSYVPELWCLEVADKFNRSVYSEPHLVATLTFSDVFIGSQQGSIIMDLRDGERIPPRTQRFALHFPNGAPIVLRHNTTTDSDGTTSSHQWTTEDGSVQQFNVRVTVAAWSPAYLLAEAVLRYVIMVLTIFVALLMLSLHILGDPAVYQGLGIDAPVLVWWSPFSWARTICTALAGRHEPLRETWYRLPVAVHVLFALLLLSAIQADPLIGATAAAPWIHLLQIWSFQLVEWLRFMWLVMVAVFFMSLMITGGSSGWWFRQRGRGEHRPKRIEDSLPVMSLKSKALWFSCFAIVVVSAPVLYLASSIVGIRSGKSLNLPAAVGVQEHATAMIPALIAVEIVFPSLLLVFWRFRKRLIYGRMANGIDDTSYTVYGNTNRVRYSSRTLVNWLRYAYPFVMWTWVFFSTFAVIIPAYNSTFLPSYRSSELVTVLLCALTGWTIALLSVPVHKKLSLYPPHPGQRTRTTMTDDVDAPLWRRIVWPDAYFEKLKSGKVPNVGYAFETEWQQEAFDALQLDGWAVGGRTSGRRDVIRSFFCWETAMRCLNLSNEAYNEVTDEMGTLAVSEPYELTGCEARIARSCCCCFIGCTLGDPHDATDETVDVPNSAHTFTLEALDDAGNDELHHQGTHQHHAVAEGRRRLLQLKRPPAIRIEDDHGTPLVWSSRRFTEAGSVAEESRRTIEEQQRMRMKRELENHHQNDEGPLQQQRPTRRVLLSQEWDRDEPLDGSSRENSKVNRPTLTTITSTAATTTTTRIVSDQGSRPPPVTDTSDVELPEISTAHPSLKGRLHHHHHEQQGDTIGGGSNNSLTMGGRDGSREGEGEGDHGTTTLTSIQTNVTSSSLNSSMFTLTTNNGSHVLKQTNKKLIRRDATPSATMPVTQSLLDVNSGSGGGGAAMPEIDVVRYGYQLIKVLDIYGVRIIIAATPPGTHGRHQHLTIAFRGTVNLRNALTDLNGQMQQSLEMPDGCQTHSGFLNAFVQQLPQLTFELRSFFCPRTAATSFSTTTAVADQLWLDSLSSIVCTGHSLGGALAMLCAYSLVDGALAKNVLIPLNVRCRVVCYTFGMPAAGNQRFADRYNLMVPETYRIVNENDVIPRFGFCWQAHVGRPVRINRDGDVILEGTWLEREYQHTVGVGSMFKNHLLDRYANSLDNCICERNLKLLSPDCCSFLLVHVEEDEVDNDVMDEEDGDFVVVTRSTTPRNSAIQESSL